MRTFQITYVQSETIILSYVQIPWNLYRLQCDVNAILATLRDNAAMKNTCHTCCLQRSGNVLTTSVYLTFAWRNLFSFLGIKIRCFLFPISLNTHGSANAFCSLRSKCPFLFPGRLLHELFTCSVFLDMQTNPDVLSQISLYCEIKQK